MSATAARYAVAAAATQQLRYTSALCHKMICLQARGGPRDPQRSAARARERGKVAQNAPLKDRRASLGLIYDETARRTWSERAAAGVAGFEARAPLRAARSRCGLAAARQVNAAACAFNEEILRAAEAEYDRCDRRCACQYHCARVRVRADGRLTKQSSRPAAPAQPNAAREAREREPASSGGHWGSSWGWHSRGSRGGASGSKRKADRAWQQGR